MKHNLTIKNLNRLRRLGLFSLLFGAAVFACTQLSAADTFENNLTTTHSFFFESNTCALPPLHTEVSSKTDYATLHNSGTAGATPVALAGAMMPVIDTEFSCNLRENPLGSGGNATTLENGQFIDFVRVTSVTGENWTVVSADGFFDISSLPPPASPTPIAPGTPLTESFAGSGVYRIMGVHVENLGYSLTVTNGTDVLTATLAAGACAYPNPAFIDLAAGYCLTSPAVTLQADNGGADGTGTFTIFNDDGSTNTANATVFDPAALGTGSYVVEFNFSETGGATQAIQQEVDVTGPVGTLSCNDNLQISFQQNCETLLTADMILEGEYESFNIFTIEVLDGFTPIANPVTDAFADEELTVRVTENCNGNSCEATVTLEDKLAPVIDCPAAPIVIQCTTNAGSIPAPTAADNCDGAESATLIDSNTTEFDCDDPNGLLRRIERIYTAFDNNGNQTAANCTQIIEIERADLIDVTFPTDAVFDCGTVPNTNPSVTGRPLLNGVPIVNNNVCNFNSFFTDNVIETCGNSFKIVRSWTVMDWCNNSSTPTNTILAEQVIKIQDITAPTIVCPDAISVSTSGEDCTATFVLPAAQISDACGTTTSQIFSPGGIITDNVISNLQIGNTFLNYTATDECGNFADCTTALTVTDGATPTAVCDEITAITLNPSGTAEVAAEEFDDGSFDGCTGIDFTVSRDALPFTPTVVFDCADANTTVIIDVQVTDAFGNSNTCEVQVNVTDNTAPELMCAPNDITIDCTENFEDFFTIPTITETCGVMPTQQTTVENINSCGTGIVTRTYTITDASGNTATCTQTITLENNNFLTAADIEFPDDFDLAVCGTSLESLAPDSLPVGFQFPIVDDVPCSQIAISRNDETFDTDGACLTIQRTWTVINWCTYDPDNPAAGGIFSDVQSITVSDDEPPVLVCPPNPFVKIINPNCDTTIFVFGPDTLMDCSPNLQLSSTLQRIPTDDSDNVLMSSQGFGPYEDLLPGFYEVFLFADDGCGNSSNCDYILQVQDNKAPTPYCFDTLVVVLMETGMIEYNVRNFDAGSFDNCTAPEDLLFSYTPNPFDSLQIFTCDDLGNNTVLMHVTDEGMNTDVCQVTLQVQNTMADCGNMRNISGYVRTEIAEDVADTEIAVNDDAMSMTDEEGYYSIDVNEGGDYTLVPEKDINPLNGISTLDVVLIKQHILGLQILDSPYKRIAADINNSTTITTADVVALRRLVLGIDETFQSNTSWRFVDAAYEFPNPDNPWETGFPEFANVNNLTEDAAIDFVAVKIGDLNNSVNGLNFSGDETGERSEADFIFDLKNQSLAAGESAVVHFSKADLADIAGLQMSLNFAAEKLELTEVIAENGIELSAFNVTQKAAGKIALSFENATGQKENLSFALRFTTKTATDLKSALRVDNEILRSEVYRKNGGNYSVENIGLTFSESVASDFALYQNTPNPFATETQITFNLPQADEVTLRIFDAAGKEILRRKVNAAKGFNTLTLQKTELNGASGLLFYRLESGEFSAVKRMIVR